MTKQQPITPRWQPIETAPKDGTPVACYTAGGAYVCVWNGAEWVDFHTCSRPIWSPTHWMPLPSSPVTLSGGGEDGAQSENVVDDASRHVALNCEPSGGVPADTSAQNSIVQNGLKPQPAPAPQGEEKVGYFNKGNIDWEGWQGMMRGVDHAAEVLADIVHAMDNADRTPSEMRLMERARMVLRERKRTPAPAITEGEYGICPLCGKGEPTNPSSYTYPEAPR